MRFLIKEISISRKEVRVTIYPINFLDTPHYIFGQINGTFNEGSMDNKYIPTTLSPFASAGPNPGIIRSTVAFLKDNFGMPGDFVDSFLITKDNHHVSIVNAVIDDINLINLSSETLPSLVLKLLDPLPTSALELDEISIEKQIDLEKYEINKKTIITLAALKKKAPQVVAKMGYMKKGGRVKKRKQ